MVAKHGVSGDVLGQDGVHLRPRADVDPVEASGDEEQAIGFLHDRVVDGVLRKIGVKRGCACLVPGHAAAEHLAQGVVVDRRVLAKLRHECLHAPAEDR